MALMFFGASNAGAISISTGGGLTRAHFKWSLEHVAPMLQAHGSGTLAGTSYSNHHDLGDTR
jgi:hypothetical protein